jgi:predicted permease
METLWQDLRYGIRTLRRNPAFTLIALLSLGLGIGANTAIFSLIDVMMLKSMPVQRPEQLALFTVYQLDHDPSLSFSFPLVERFQANQETFSGVMASAGGGRMHMNVSGNGDQSELVRPDRVTGNFFEVLGINPVLGRVFTEDDDRKYDAHAVAVISYNFWKRRFALDPGVIGKQITLNDFPFMIIGVTPPGFTGMEVGGNPDIWFPLWMVDQFPDAIPNRANSSMVQTGSWWLRVIGRLKPGVRLARAQSEMDVILQQMLTEMAETRSKNWTTATRTRFYAQRIILQPGGAGFSFLRLRFAKPLYILMTIVGLVLLIACANVANLLLARAAMRQKEIGVRLSIGAGRLRLIRQLLTESVLLAVLGGALGLALSRVFTGLLVAYLTAQQTNMTLDLNPNAHILGFTFAVSVLTGILFGLAPALRATGFDLVPALKETTEPANGQEPHSDRQGTGSCASRTVIVPPDRSGSVCSKLTKAKECRCRLRFRKSPGIHARYEPELQNRTAHESDQAAIGDTGNAAWGTLRDCYRVYTVEWKFINNKCNGNRVCANCR